MSLTMRLSLWPLDDRSRAEKAAFQVPTMSRQALCLPLTDASRRAPALSALITTVVIAMGKAYALLRTTLATGPRRHTHGRDRLTLFRKQQTDFTSHQLIHMSGS